LIRIEKGRVEEKGGHRMREKKEGERLNFKRRKERKKKNLKEH